MAEHSSGGNPLANAGTAIFGGIMGLLSLVLLAGVILGTSTGNAPIKGSITNVWDIGNFAGAVLNLIFNSGAQTFGDEKYFQNSKKIGSDTKPQQRLMAPNQIPNTILPTSSKTNDASVVNTATLALAPYEDSNGDGIISPEEISAQNKARN